MNVGDGGGSLWVELASCNLQLSKVDIRLLDRVLINSPDKNTLVELTGGNSLS